MWVEICGRQDIGQKGRRKIDEETKRQTIELYRRGLSEREVARALRISSCSVHYILVASNEPRRSISEACMKYSKTDFSGDLDERARLLGFLEDCYAWYSGRQIGIRTNTTHPAQMNLFDDVFGEYGHVGITPSYNEQHSYYELQLWMYLNATFNFVIEYKRNPMKFLSEIGANGHDYFFAGSLTDAEGSVGIYDDTTRHHPTVILSISNNNRATA